MLALLLAFSSCAEPSHTLRGVAPADLTVGTAVTSDPAALSDPDYRRILAEEFSSLTPDVPFKWSALQHARGEYDFSAADELVAMAEANRQSVRGHTLLWHGGLPAWVGGVAKTCASAREVLRAHIISVVGHFRGRVAQWDVANELLDDAGRARGENPFLAACGPSIVAEAFTWAHTADPEARLYLNDYGNLGTGAKSDAEFALVKGLVDAGVPIHGVGFQSHLTVADGVPDGAAANLQRYADLGLDVAITEADVRMPVSAGAPTRSQLDAQARVFTELLGVCLAQSRCTGFTLWGFSDRWSWVPAVLPDQGWACPLDAAFNERPAWTALRGTLAAGRP